MTTTHQETAPEDRIPFPQKVAYGSGAFVNNLLAAAIGNMMIVLNLGLGMNPALVGLLGGLPRITDALTDPLMGYISDNTKSTYGRRRPYIFFGAIAAGVLFMLLWQLPRGYSDTFYFVYFLIGSILFFGAYTVFATPWVALGFELTPDYHERTRLMGVQFMIGQIPYVLAPWFLWIMTYEGFFKDQIQGASGLAVMIGILAIGLGILPAIFLREPPVPTQEPQPSGESAPRLTLLQNVGRFFGGFFQTLRSGPFLMLGAATFLVFNGFQLIASFQSYVIIYYVLEGDQELGAQYFGYAGTLQTAATFAVIPLVTWMSTRIGKRRAFFVSMALSCVGFGLKWFSYTPENPWLVLIPAPLMAFSLGSLFTLMPSMIADVVDYDEIETHERREGMFGSIFWWMVKVGMAVALAAGGFLLNWTGFDVELGTAQTADAIFWMRLCDATVPILTTLVAMAAIYAYPLTEQRALEIRATLEARRGPAQAAG